MAKNNIIKAYNLTGTVDISDSTDNDELDFKATSLEAGEIAVANYNTTGNNNYYVKQGIYLGNSSGSAISQLPFITNQKLRLNTSTVSVVANDTTERTGSYYVNITSTLRQIMNNTVGDTSDCMMLLQSGVQTKTATYGIITFYADSNSDFSTEQQVAQCRGYSAAGVYNIYMIPMFWTWDLNYRVRFSTSSSGVMNRVGIQFDGCMQVY